MATRSPCTSRDGQSVAEPYPRRVASVGQVEKIKQRMDELQSRYPDILGGLGDIPSPEAANLSTASSGPAAGAPAVAPLISAVDVQTIADDILRDVPGKDRPAVRALATRVAVSILRALWLDEVMMPGPEVQRSPVVWVRSMERLGRLREEEDKSISRGLFALGLVQGRQVQIDAHVRAVRGRRAAGAR